MNHRFLLPLIIGFATSFSGMAQSAKEKTSEPKKSYRSSLTYIHGPEDFADSIYATNRINPTNDAMSGHPETYYSLLGDGKASLSYDTIAAEIAKLKDVDAPQHDVIIRFHGGVKMDTAATFFYFSDHPLQNDRDIICTNILYSSALFKTLGKSFEELHDKKPVTIRYVPCQGMLGIVGMGYLPSGTDVLVHSPFYEGTLDHQSTLVQGFAYGAKPEHLIETSLIWQNSHRTPKSYEWNELNYVIFVSDTLYETPLVIEGDTVDLGPRKCHVLNLNKTCVTEFKIFGREELTKRAREYPDLIEESEIDPLMDLWEKVQDIHDFQNTLSENQRRKANVLIYAQFKQDKAAIAALPTTEDQLLEYHVIPRDGFRQPNQDN